VAACVIAMAMLLFVFILKPWGIPEMLMRKESVGSVRQKSKSLENYFLPVAMIVCEGTCPTSATLWTAPPSAPERLLRLRRAESPGSSSLPGSCDGEFDVLR
jgi:hypothetical protein